MYWSDSSSDVFKTIIKKLDMIINLHYGGVELKRGLSIIIRKVT